MALISTPISEAWPTWLMLGLLLCLVLGEVLQPETLKLAFRTTFSKAERMYGDRAKSIYGLTFLNIFRVGTVAMALYVYSYHTSPFAITTFGLLMLLVIAFVGIKSVLSMLVSYTFNLRKMTALYGPQYNNLWTVLCVLLYPIILLYINVPHVALLWLPVVLLILFVVLLVIKSWQYYYAGPLSLVYLLIYIMTLELLPMGALWFTTNSLT